MGTIPNYISVGVINISIYSFVFTCAYSVFVFYYFCFKITTYPFHSDPTQHLRCDLTMGERLDEFSAKPF